MANADDENTTRLTLCLAAELKMLKVPVVFMLSKSTGVKSSSPIGATSLVPYLGSMLGGVYLEGPGMAPTWTTAEAPAMMPSMASASRRSALTNLNLGLDLRSARTSDLNQNVVVRRDSGSYHEQMHVCAIQSNRKHTGKIESIRSNDSFACSNKLLGYLPSETSSSSGDNNVRLSWPKDVV